MRDCANSMYLISFFFVPCTVADLAPEPPVRPEPVPSASKAAAPEKQPLPTEEVSKMTSQKSDTKKVDMYTISVFPFPYSCCCQKAGNRHFPRSSICGSARLFSPETSLADWR